MATTAKWITGYSTAYNFLKNFAREVTKTELGTEAWAIEFPKGADPTAQLAGVLTEKRVILKTTPTGRTKPVFVELKYPDTIPQTDTTTKKNYHYLQVRFGEGYDVTKDTWPEDSVSEWGDWVWFRRDTQATIKWWLPVSYYMTVTKDTLACVIMGDPNANFDDYLISFAFFGRVKSFENGDADVVGNFGVTVSSDKEPPYPKTYGDKTGNLVTDITMLKTRSGYPFQAHVMSMTTPDEFVDKHILGPSNWTHKYHMSPAYIYHGVDGYRGELENVIVTDRSSVVHQDELIVNKGSVDPLKPEEIYKYFAVNAPYSIFNNSANVLFGVAMLKPSTDASTVTPEPEPPVVQA